MSAAAGGEGGDAALAQPPAGLGSEGGDAAPPLAGAPNPFEGVQRPGRERTLKYALWEVLARHYPGGAHASELERDERLFELRPSLRERKNPSGQVIAAAPQLPHQPPLLPRLQRCVSSCLSLWGTAALLAPVALTACLTSFSELRRLPAS